MKGSKARAAPFRASEDEAGTYETGTDDIGGTAGDWAVAGDWNSWLGLAGSEETHGQGGEREVGLRRWQTGIGAPTEQAGVRR